jgi:Transposase DDE domain
LIRLDMTRARKSSAKKRHTAVDTIGLLINVVVTPADVQDRHIIAALLATARKRFPSLKKAFADGGCQGKLTGRASRLRSSSARISPRVSGLPKHWVC